MTTSRDFRPTTIRSEADLFLMWQTLMGSAGFGHRSVWVMFLDRLSRTLPVLMPVDDIPRRPDARFIHGLATVISGVVTDGEAAAAAMLISRPGEAAMTPDDRAWAGALRDAVGELSPWPVHLATPDRLQVFAPDDLIAIA
ncbi:MAG TPA: hypothetical protein VGN18_10125 [Jatrophihabitans sp.]|jgi:hypothetical protein|uniref:hypothetical protein n=1 Tax=Jatrophihabitans sp. TaxID=1932789 RepID=UPI002E033A5D|nr:hypothetical protein [Jatrophihabitans sp.]